MRQLARKFRWGCLGLALVCLVPVAGQAGEQPAAGALGKPLSGPTLRFDVPHVLPFETAKHRVALLTAYWGEKYGIKTQWAGNAADISGRMWGMDMNAHLEVTEKKVGGELSDPGFFFRGTAQNYLRRKFATYLDPKNNW